MKDFKKNSSFGLFTLLRLKCPVCSVYSYLGEGDRFMT